MRFFFPRANNLLRRNHASIQYSLSDSHQIGQRQKSDLKAHESQTLLTHLQTSQDNPKNVHENQPNTTMMTRRSALHESDSSLRSLQSSKGSCVSFTTIAVHEHAMILSDGPSVSGGPAVQLDWFPQSESTMSLNDYEASKTHRRRKPYPQMLIPGAFRTAILLESGYTMNEIKESTSKHLTPKPSMRKTVSDKMLKMLKSHLLISPKSRSS